MAAKKILNTCVVLMIAFVIFTLFSDTHVKATEQSDSTGQEVLMGNEFTKLAKEVTFNSQNTLMVATDKGLYLLDDAYNVKFKVSTRHRIKDAFIVGDLNNNGFDDVLIRYNKRLTVYDSKDESVLWVCEPKMESYDSSLGYYMENVIIEDFELKDNTITGLAGYLVFQLDLVTGQANWQYMLEDNGWDIQLVKDINSDGTKDYIVAVQGGDVLLFSGKNGKVIWEELISEAVFDERNKEYKTSIWDFAYEANSNQIYAVSEIRTIYKLDLYSGNKEEVIDRFAFSEEMINRFANQRELGDGYNSSLFKAQKIEFINDYDGDGKNDLLFDHDIRNENNNYHNPNLTPSIKLLGTKDDLEEIWSFPAEYKGNMENSFFKGFYNNESAFYQIMNSVNTDGKTFLNTRVFSFETGDFVDGEIQIPYNSYQGSAVLKTIRLSDGNNAILFRNRLSIYGSTLEEKNTQISLIHGTEKVDMERYTLHANKVTAYYGNYKYVSFDLYDHTNNQTMWDYTVNKEDYAYYGNFKYYDFTEDINNDGFNDLVLILDRDGYLHADVDITNGMKPDQIVIVDGKTGKELTDFRQEIIIPRGETILDEEQYDLMVYARAIRESHVQSFEFVNDLNNDGHNELMISMNTGEIYFYDLHSNQEVTLIDFYTGNPNLFIEWDGNPEDPTVEIPNVNEIDNHHFLEPLKFSGRLMPVEDTNNDGLKDFLYFVDHQMISINTDVSGGNITLVAEDSSSVEVVISSRTKMEYRDINSNGSKELVIATTYEQKYQGDKNLPDNAIYIYAINTSDKTVLYQKQIPINPEYSNGGYVYLDDDFNADGINELVYITQGFTDKGPATEMIIYDIQNDQELLNKKTERGYLPQLDIFKPYLMIEDTDDNGKDELILTLGNRDLERTRLEFYEQSDNGMFNKKDEVLIALPRQVDNRYVYYDSEEWNFHSYIGTTTINNQLYLYGTIDDVEFISRGEHSFGSTSYNSTFLYNLNEHKLEAIFKETILTDIADKGQNELLIGTNTGEEYVTTLNNTLQIKNLKDGATINKRINLEFTNKLPGEVYIYVDDQMVGRTDKNQFKIGLIEGEHTIKVGQLTEDGTQVFYSVDVEVTKNYTYMIVIPLITTILIASVTILPRKRTTYKNPLLVKEGSERNE